MADGDHRPTALRHQGANALGRRARGQPGILLRLDAGRARDRRRGLARAHSGLDTTASGASSARRRPSFAAARRPVSVSGRSASGRPLAASA